MNAASMRVFVVVASGNGALRKYAWRPSPLDPRNYVAEPVAATSPPTYDPRADLPPVFDQLQIGSCTSNATATAFRYHFMQRGEDPGELSRLWIYGSERMREGDFPEDAGAEGHDAFKVARREGLVLENAWPYGDGSTFNDVTAYTAAKQAHPKVRIASYAHPHPDLETFKSVLSSGRPIAFGFPVYESFESAQVASTGVVPLPSPREQLLGGHEVLLVGYVQHEGELYFLVMNSWGTEWGLSGFFLMPVAYVLGRGSSDWRCVNL